MPRINVVLGALAGLETTWAFSAFNPSVFTIRKFVDDPEGMMEIRKGYLIGAAFGIGFAWFISRLSGSTLPLMVAIVISILFIGVYEAAIRGLV